MDLFVWRAKFVELMARIGGRFVRVEPRQRAARLVTGLLSDLAVKNCWTLAEHAGESAPDGMQRLLRTACWDEDGVLADVRDFVGEHLADPAAVLVIDETGDQKKGDRTVGVQRQYSGTCGRIENCQVAVYASYVSAKGHTPIDVELYLPESWTSDPDRLRAAGVPDGIGFATKPALARRMLARALHAQLPFSWAAADEVYGADPRLRADLESAGVGYVLAVACDHRFFIGRMAVRADGLAAGLPKRAWQTLSAGKGSKGHRLYEWAWVSTTEHPTGSGFLWLLIRRNRKTGELAFYRCYSPRRVGLATLVKIAGSRWPIETDFQTSKGQTGLDQHQVRRWTSWRRWTIMCILAHAILTVTTALARARTPGHDDPTTGIIPLTVPETRRLLNTWTIKPATNLSHHLHWSRWRRRRQAQARRCHYQRRKQDHEVPLPY